MPELPEVEVLRRHLAPLIEGQTVTGLVVRREKVIRPTSKGELRRALKGARLGEVRRRGKYLVFGFGAGPSRPSRGGEFLVHLGMTGRLFLQPLGRGWPKHTATALKLGASALVFQDTRYFGRLTLDTRSLDRLGPEPLGPEFRLDAFVAALGRSGQAVKVRLLDQSLVAGIGNIYASEALHRARISPTTPARAVDRAGVIRLKRAIRAVLTEAIEWGSTVPLDWSGEGPGDGLFYYGRAVHAPDFYEERLRVYDRKGKPCGRCRGLIERIEQVGRSTYFCPRCQVG